MKRSVLLGCLFCAIVPVTVLAAASYYEASGQTIPFTLAAGATGSWDKTTSPIIAISKVPTGSFGIASIASVGGSMRIMFNGTVPANALVTVFNMRGARVAAAPISGSSVSIGSDLASGAYAVRVVANGVAVSTSRFTMVR